MEKFHKIGGASLIFGSFLLFAYAALFPLLLPVGAAKDGFSQLVTHPAWLGLAACAFAGILAMMLGFAAVYTKLFARGGTAGLAAFLVVELAYLLQACKVTWEFCIYPVLAKHQACVFLLNERVLKNDPLVVGFRTFASLSILVGIVWFCTNIIRSRVFPKPAGWLVLTGAFLYGVGPLFSIAVFITGIAAFSVGCWILGRTLCRMPCSSPAA